MQRQRRHQMDAEVVYFLIQNPDNDYYHAVIDPCRVTT